jgi:hypothetical protein
MLFSVVIIGASATATNPRETVLYSFQGPPDGLYPVGRLASDNAGHLYGKTSPGTVLPSYRLKPVAAFAGRTLRGLS